LKESKTKFLIFRVGNQIFLIESNMSEFINNLIIFAYKQGDKNIQHHIQGAEIEIPGMYISGHPPTPPSKVYAVAYISIVALLVIAGLLQNFLRKKWLQPHKRQEKEGADHPVVKHRILKTIAIILIIVIFFFVSLEGILQVYVYFNPYQEFIPDPQAHWKINPAIRRTIQSSKGSYLPDLDGVPDWEYGRNKKPGAYRILCYGDSQTNGTPHVILNYSFPKVLQNKLGETFPDRDIQSINMGIPAYSSFQGLLFFKNIGMLYNPDCIIVGLGYHDAGDSLAPDKDVTTDNPRVKKLRGILYRSQIYLLIRKKILEMHSEQREPGNKPSYFRVSTEDYRKNLKEFADIGKKRNLKIIFLTVPQLGDDSTHHPEYTEVMRKAARDFDIVLVDAVDAMSKIPLDKQKEFFVDDGVHFSQRGNEFMAEIILQKIKFIFEKSGDG